MTGIAGEDHLHDVDRFAERFEAARPRLLRIAQRMLGSASECDDALQESWLRIDRADTESVINFDAWLTTIVSRVCLDALNRRSSRREDLTPDDPRRDMLTTAPGERPEEEALLADSIGLALLVLLDALPPAERVAYVLHDMFDVPFETIAGIVGRTTEAARQLASRARRRVRGASSERDATTQRNDELVRAFLAASRAGHFGALVSLLDPDATLHADATVMAMGGTQYFQQDGVGGGIRGRRCGRADIHQTRSRRSSRVHRRTSGCGVARRRRNSRDIPVHRRERSRDGDRVSGGPRNYRACRHRAQRLTTESTRRRPIACMGRRRTREFSEKAVILFG